VRAGEEEQPQRMGRRALLARFTWNISFATCRSPLRNLLMPRLFSASACPLTTFICTQML
jgi:hypothetical protein